jgi:hypothetical protein
VKVISENELNCLSERLNLENNDLVLIISGKYKVVKTSLGALRCKLAKDLELIQKGDYKLLWVVDFPSFEYSEEENRYMACHHPFTSPKDSDVDKLFNLVMILLGFYILYAIQNVFDSTFYGLGKTNYMLFESVVTNSIYYGIAFILYATNIWTPTLTGIALLFGIGNAFDSIVSLIVYVYLLKKENINILNVE